MNLTDLPQPYWQAEHHANDDAPFHSGSRHFSSYNKDLTLGMVLSLNITGYLGPNQEIVYRTNALCLALNIASIVLLTTDNFTTV